MNNNSIQAHESIKPDKPTLYKKIREALEVIGNGTFRQIAKQANLEDMQVWKRLSEMERLGIISNVADRVCTVSNRSCSVWQINN